jgi:hypothetical protein
VHSDSFIELCERSFKLINCLGIAVTEFLDADDECTGERVNFASNACGDRGLPLVLEHQGLYLGLDDLAVLL